MQKRAKPDIRDLS
jgi:hypothetical protein